MTTVRAESNRGAGQRWEEVGGNLMLLLRGVLAIAKLERRAKSMVEKYGGFPFDSWCCRPPRVFAKGLGRDKTRGGGVGANVLVSCHECLPSCWSQTFPTDLASTRSATRLLPSH